MKYISSSSYFGRGGRRLSGAPFVEEEEETESYRSRGWYGSGLEWVEPDGW